MLLIVVIIVSKGQFLRTFGRCGKGRGEFNCPDGITVDTSEGQFVTSFGGMGKRPGELNCPYGLAVDNSGVVYVCDSDNNRLQMFNFNIIISCFQ